MENIVTHFHWRASLRHEALSDKRRLLRAPKTGIINSSRSRVSEQPVGGGLMTNPNTDTLKDYYAILGVLPSADSVVISAAFRAQRRNIIQIHGRETHAKRICE